LPVRLPDPDLQIDFSACLAAAREAYLIDALSAVVGALDIPQLDAELAKVVPADCMRTLASAGLRAEYVFPVPSVLRGNPRLLSYYRLLLGHSQKLFYQACNGTGPYRCMEDAGTLPACVPLDSLCAELARGLCLLVKGIGAKRITIGLLDDLTLLTLGPQLRGGVNVRKGRAGIQAILDLIHPIVRRSVLKRDDRKLVLRNAAGRHVFIEFASDPDIVIREVIARNEYRNIIAIEVKGGTDFSNIHNRVGEAEKSHQKARLAGYVECWTIVNVHKLDEETARSESPTTNRFFCLPEIAQPGSKEYRAFRNRILALTGLSTGCERGRVR
jgi:hypothetical protein